MSPAVTDGRVTAFGGLQIITTSALPLVPSVGEEARRRVRHGLAHVLEWLGEDVGPAPETQTHALQLGDGIVAVSHELADVLPTLIGGRQ